MGSTPERVNITENSAEGTFRFGEEAPAKPATDFLSLVPEEFRNEEFVQNAAKTETPIPNLFKQFKEAQKLVGQKSQPTPPAPDAPPEIKKAFFKSLGVPDDINGYEVKPIEWEEIEKELGTKIEANRNPELMEFMKKSALEANLTPSQFQDVVKAFEKFTVKETKKFIEGYEAQNKKYDEDFDRKMQLKFGANVDSVKSVGRNLIANLADEEEKKAFMGFDNEQATHLASFLKKIHDRFIREDGFTRGGQIATSQEDRRKKGQALIASEAFNQPLHVDHDRVVKEVHEIYGTTPRPRG